MFYAYRSLTANPLLILWRCSTASKHERRLPIIPSKQLVNLINERELHLLCTTTFCKSNPRNFEGMPIQEGLDGSGTTAESYFS